MVQLALPSSDADVYEHPDHKHDQHGDRTHGQFRVPGQGGEVTVRGQAAIHGGFPSMVRAAIGATRVPISLSYPACPLSNRTTTRQSAQAGPGPTSSTP